MWEIKTDAVSGMMKFNLVDDDGDSVAFFRINPTDIRLVSRFQEAAVWFDEMAKSAPDGSSMEVIQRFNDDLEEKLSYVLGGNSRESLFGVIPAISIMPSGNLFAVEVFEKMHEAIGPEIAARKNKLQNAVSKYTAKYQ